MLFRFFSCACVAVGLGFGSYTTSNQIITPKLPPTQWVLHTLEGKSLPKSRLEGQPRLVLSSAGAARSIHRTGPFQQSLSDRLRTIPRVISTMMRRNDQTMELELRYLSVLKQSTRYEVTGNTLYLYAPEQATPLATFWVVSSAL
jgi:heat shock protein HslJ